MSEIAKASRAGRRRGVATIEFALVLPLLMLIALLFIFFTKGMLSKQNVLSTDRQFAWRQAKQLPPPGEFQPGEIRDLYFRDQPIDYNITGGTNATRQPEQDMVDAAQSRNPLAGGYADDLIMQVCPSNVSQGVRLDFPLESIPLSQFSRTITDNYYREGITWQRNDVQVWATLRDRFLQTFDDRMVGAQAPAGYVGLSLDRSLVLQLRQLYLKKW
ncbi:MAG: TadE/TadG family type IV pilus assembly protein [Phycisphaerae bacterium]|nr:TadE/TadG family type IV pilus assembly protein [Phycisphaerae bacterium]